MSKYQEKDIEFAQRLLTDRKTLDSREVRIWLSERHHRELLDDAAALRGALTEMEINEEKEYTRLLRSLSGNRRKHRLFRWIAAASIACVFGVATYMWQEKTVAPRLLSSASSPLSHPSRQVELTLANGERMVLDGKNGIIGSNRESGIRESDNAGLDYSEASVTGKEEAFNTLKVPVGGFYSIQLADGTKVWVNSVSSLRYPVAFTGEKRKVFLTGEAYFDVAQSATHPFIVEANGVEIQVYGTEFNINAYEPDQVQTVLVEGSVGMRVMASGKEVRLRPNQKAEYREGQESLRLTDVDPYPYTAWRNGEFVFDQESLESILERLGRWYDIQVFYTGESLKQHKFSGIINRYEEIKDVLRLIEQVAIVRFEIKGNTVVVKPAVELRVK